MCWFVEKCWKRQKLTFGDLWSPDHWPDQKKKNWPKSSRHYFWRSIECRLPRVVTWPRNPARRGSSVFRKSRGGGARARRAPFHPGRAPYGRHWRDSEDFFFGPEGALRPEKGLIVVGGRLREPFNYIFPVKTFAIGERQTIAKGALGSQGRPWPSAPRLRPWMYMNV